VFDIYEKLIQGLLEKGIGSVDNWFSQDELDCLRKSLLGLYENDYFHLAGIGNKDNLRAVKKIRNDRVYWLNNSASTDCERQFFRKVDDFVDYLNRTCFAGIREYEFHYAVYEKGSFYLKHVDQFKNDSRRKYSLVAYLTDNWQAGDGGELLLYPGDTTAVIEPVPGRMILFNSTLPHEVLISKKQRLSLTGWLKTS
jgi:SM-20-related protein